MTTVNLPGPSVHVAADRSDRFGHIRALDGIRGIAYLLVLGHHCFFAAVPQGSWPLADWVLIRIFSFGYLGVDVFFVLSGFLITTLLLMDRRERHYYRNFYVKRAFRILPAFLAVLIIIWIARLCSTAYALLSLVFLVNFAYLFHVMSDGPFWSLAVEEQFYLIWPQVIRRLTARTIGKILWIIILAEPIIRLLMTAGHHAIAYYTFTRCDGLAWGALLATESRLHQLLLGGPGARRWWRNRGLPVFAVGSVFTAASVALTFSRYGDRWSATALLSACPLFFVGSMAFILTHRASFAAAILSSPILRFFGDISYSSYLTHIYILDLYNRAAGPLVPGQTLPFLARGAIVLALTTGLCTASLYGFERPMMRLRRRFLAQ
jgi:peptidoglycan/LPS O-acetylase OafA/YrhL